MKRSDLKYFYQPNFLDSELHELMLDTKNQCLDFGMTIDSDGSIVFDKGYGDGHNSGTVFRNRYKDNSIIKDNLSQPFKSVIDLLEIKLIENGVKNPVIFNLGMMINPNPSPSNKNYGWHKDYNIIDHIQDPLKLWFTIFSLTKNEVTSEFMVSPTSEGVDYWKLGVKEIVDSNKLFAHNMNLGHQYIVGNKNEVTIMYGRWYDAE
jgi:hypothetical protein